jgi:uncharacterized protein YjdB
MKKRFSYLCLMLGLLFAMAMFTACTESIDDKIIYGVGGVKLSKVELTLTVGDQPVELVATVLPLNATHKTVTWTTSDPSVVTVSGDGETTESGVTYSCKVTPVGPGNAIITARAESKTASCTVKVNAAE